MEIRFEIRDESLRAALARAVAALSDFTPAMEDIASHMEEETRGRFETGRAPDGTPWLPSQRVLEQGGQTLIDSGQLLASIARAFDRTSAVAGTNLVYARIHQAGGTIRPRAKKALKTPFGPRASVRMPARPFLGFGAAEEDYIPRRLARHLGQAFDGSAP
jgi:phage virion morphogenesis protein